MKNFDLKRVGGRRGSWVLLQLHVDNFNQVEYLPFTHFIEWMEHTKGLSQNSIEQYAGHVARFIDFVYEASKTDTSTVELYDLIHLYQQYLLFGPDCTDRRVRELCRRLGKSKPTSISSISHGIEYSIGYFLTHQLDLIDQLDANNVLSNFIIKQIERKPLELSNINKKDWLTSTVRGSLSRAKPIGRTKVFTLSRKESQTGNNLIMEDAAYPLEMVTALLSMRPKHKSPAFHRDMALYSLLASSGCRPFEALQLRVNDIDVKNFKVFIRNPFKGKISGLTEAEKKKLDWKGRQIEDTFLIAPFDHYFWDHLREYLQSFYKTNVNHDFLFQKQNGRPYYTIDRSTRNKRFKTYASHSGYHDPKVGLKGFRHMYGRYLLNYFPTDQGFGMPIAYVKILMGHASLSSTEKYAIHDNDLLNLYIETANRQIHQEMVSLEEIKLRYIDEKIKKLEEYRRIIDV